MAHGCTFVREGKGSHEIWQSPISMKRFSVPATIVSRAHGECDPEAGGYRREDQIGVHRTVGFTRSGTRACCTA
jgi:hypothetical protein